MINFLRDAHMVTAIILIAVVIIAALAFYSLYRRGRHLSQEAAYMPKPGMFDAERDAKWRQYDDKR